MRSLATTLETKRWQGQDIFQRTADMQARTAALAPLTECELDDVLYSLQNLQVDKDEASVDYTAVRTLLAQVAHLSHKDWSVTQANGARLRQALWPHGLPTLPSLLLERVWTEGQWAAAVAHAKSRLRSSSSSKPWAVLVTGVNGIRKTTSLSQDWFPQLLAEALVAPSSSVATNEVDTDLLPTGHNSFFRQLDHMIASLCNEDFGILYQLTDNELQKQKKTNSDESSPLSPLEAYADLKAAIFGRYRTLSELLGAALLDHAKTQGTNCLMETSGRDVAMFHYVNHFFSSTDYHKLALHFEINDLMQAQASVDHRMQGEVEAGLVALAAKSARAVVYANAGGPYGAAALPGVQAASDEVWQTQIQPSDSAVAADWYKATIQVQAYDDRPWTAQAVKPDGSPGTLFNFAPLS
jgi:hypothetical protein